MKIDHVALVLQGGAVRGAFTAGVIDVFMENDVYFSYLVGVSAGALIALNYLSRQIGRSCSLVIDSMSDRKFISKRFLITKHSLYNFGYLFGEMAKTKLPFDFATFEKSPIKLVVGATSCLTGKDVYFTKGETNEFFQAVAASSSLPLMSAPVMVENVPCLDGGISAPIPFQKALDDGFKKMIVITTRDRSYRKDVNKPQHRALLKVLYPKYPLFIETALNYPQKYNECADQLEKIEASGQALVIRPQVPIMLKRTEKDKAALQQVYLQGRSVALELLPKVIEYLK